MISLLNSGQLDIRDARENKARWEGYGKAGATLRVSARIASERITAARCLVVHEDA
jgi:hypothetical protein